MKELTRRSLIAASAAAAATGAFAPAPVEAATGAISIEIFRAGFIVGVSGGRGVLHFGGRRYGLRIGGVTAGATIGAASARLYGSARRMRYVRDIEGVYSAMAAGVSVINGPSAADLANAHGVVLHLRGSQTGIMFSIDLAGMSITLA
jgi:hypothetical protein